MLEDWYLLWSTSSFKLSKNFLVLVYSVQAPWSLKLKKLQMQRSSCYTKKMDVWWAICKVPLGQCLGQKLLERYFRPWFLGYFGFLFRFVWLFRGTRISVDISSYIQQLLRYNLSIIQDSGIIDICHSLIPLLIK